MITKTLILPNSSIKYRQTNDGWERTWGNEPHWYFCYPPNELTTTKAKVIHHNPPRTYENYDDYSLNDQIIEINDDREIFGDTLDEPIPDDLWELINTH